MTGTAAHWKARVLAIVNADEESFDTFCQHLADMDDELTRLKEAAAVAPELPGKLKAETPPPMIPMFSPPMQSLPLTQPTVRTYGLKESPDVHSDAKDAPATPLAGDP